MGMGEGTSVTTARPSSTPTSPTRRTAWTPPHGETHATTAMMTTTRIRKILTVMVLVTNATHARASRIPSSGIAMPTAMGIPATTAQRQRTHSRRIQTAMASAVAATTAHTGVACRVRRTATAMRGPTIATTARVRSTPDQDDRNGDGIGDLCDSVSGASLPGREEQPPHRVLAASSVDRNCGLTRTPLRTIPNPKTQKRNGLPG